MNVVAVLRIPLLQLHEPGREFVPRPRTLALAQSRGDRLGCAPSWRGDASRLEQQRQHGPALYRVHRRLLAQADALPGEQRVAPLVVHELQNASKNARNKQWTK